MNIVVFAHAADYVSSIIILVPILGVSAWLLVANLRDRRRARRETSKNRQPSNKRGDKRTKAKTRSRKAG